MTKSKHNILSLVFVIVLASFMMIGASISTFAIDHTDRQYVINGTYYFIDGIDLTGHSAFQYKFISGYYNVNGSTDDFTSLKFSKDSGATYVLYASNVSNATKWVLAGSIDNLVYTYNGDSTARQPLTFHNAVVDYDTYIFLYTYCLSFDGLWNQVYYENQRDENTLIGSITDGLNGFISNLGNGVSSYFEDLFISNGELSTFAIVGLSLLGVSIAIGLAKFVIRKVG